MAYERVVDLSTDKVFALGEGKDKLSEIEGYYLGSRQVTTSNGPSLIHVFQTAKGNVGVWGTKKLNDNLTPPAMGNMMLVIYKGKVKIAGGKTQHTYEFNIDRDQRIDVPRLTVGAVPTESEEYGNNGEARQEEDEGVSEDMQQQLALAAAERQAKVQALLKRKSN